MRARSNTKSLPPILIEGVLDEPDRFRTLVETHAPYLPVQRYFGGDAEYRASSGQGRRMIVAPNFRGDWAYERPLVDGADAFFEHRGFARAAREMFGADLVRPLAVYANLTWQLPFPQGAGHTDVPAFRGIDRKRYPVWFLSAMGHSGLFEEERITIATAVAWFYGGADGGLEYWPDGPDRPSRIHEGDIFNTAILGDNDRMYHRVRPVGRPSDGLVAGMTLDTSLEWTDAGDWRIVEAGETLARFPYEKLRISVSWKAEIFRSAEEQHRVDAHVADLTFEEVLGRFCADLDARGEGVAPCEDPLHDSRFVEQLSRAYIEAPALAG